MKVRILFAVFVLIVLLLGTAIAGSVKNPEPRIKFKGNSIESISVWAFMDRETNVVCYVTHNGISCIPQGNVAMKEINTQWMEFVKREGITDESQTPYIFFLGPPPPYQTPSIIKPKDNKPEKDESL